MNVKDYISLRDSGKVAYSKKSIIDQQERRDLAGKVIQEQTERDAIVFTQKRFDSDTGAELDDSLSEVNLNSLVGRKAELQVEMDGLTAMIDDINKL